MVPFLRSNVCTISLLSCHTISVSLSLSLSKDSQMVSGFIAKNNTPRQRTGLRLSLRVSASANTSPSLPCYSSTASANYLALCPIYCAPPAISASPSLRLLFLWSLGNLPRRTPRRLSSLLLIPSPYVTSLSSP